MPTIGNRKVGVFISSITIIFALKFEWYVIKCGFKDGDYKDKCFKELGRHTQHMVTILKFNSRRT